MATGNPWNLDTELRLKLRSLRGEWPSIAEHGDLSLSWVSQFARGKIPNPGIQTLRQLAISIEALGLAKRVKSPVARKTKERSGVAQLAVRRAHNPEVGGSSPPPASTLPPELDPQHVLKAEAARPDATDRGDPDHASPVGGPMGAGQSAAADPTGDASTTPGKDLAP